MFDSQCNLIDEVLANPNWLAGDNTQNGQWNVRRICRGTLITAQAQNSIFGTPKRENSSPTQISSSGNSGTPSDNQQPTTNDQQQIAKILINEVQLASSLSTRDEFVELYNPGDAAINLTDWYLQKETQSGTLLFLPLLPRICLVEKQLLLAAIFLLPMLRQPSASKRQMAQPSQLTVWPITTFWFEEFFRRDR